MQDLKKFTIFSGSYWRIFVHQNEEVKAKVRETQKMGSNTRERQKEFSG